MAFAVRHQDENMPPTYYRLANRGHSRVGKINDATTWATEAEARAALNELGLSKDPTVSVVEV